MMAMKRHLSRSRFLGALSALGLPAGGRLGAAGAAEAYTMRCSVATAANTANDLTARRFAAAVERRSNGQIKIEVYPGGQLAGQQESIDGLGTGVVDFAMEPTVLLMPILPQYQVLDMPLLFRNIASASRVLDGPIGDELFAALEPKGITGLTWVSTGFKTLETASKPVAVPDDMKGLRVRIVGGGIFPATYQALGAIPVPIDLSETYTALSQHTVDGMDFPLESFTVGKYYTVCKRVSMLNHFLEKVALMGSKRKIEALPPALQKILKEEGRAVTAFARTLAAQREAVNIETLKANGVTFVDKPDITAFRKAVEPVYAQYRPRLGSLLDRVTRAADSV
jgi:TRAP-type transport system periplasmic protein